MPALEKLPVQIDLMEKSSYGIACVAARKSFTVTVGRYDLVPLPLVFMNLTPQIPLRNRIPMPLLDGTP